MKYYVYAVGRNGHVLHAGEVEAETPTAAVAKVTTETTYTRSGSGSDIVHTQTFEGDNYFCARVTPRIVHRLHNAHRRCLEAFESFKYATK